MYIVVITEDDFIGSEEQVKTAQKELLNKANNTTPNVINPYTSAALNSVCLSMSVDRPVSPMAEEEIAATA